MDLGVLIPVLCIVWAVTSAFFVLLCATAGAADRVRVQGTPREQLDVQASKRGPRAAKLVRL